MTEREQAEYELADSMRLLSATNLKILIASWPGTKAAEAATRELARRKRERNTLAANSTKGNA